MTSNRPIRIVISKLLNGVVVHKATKKLRNLTEIRTCFLPSLELLAYRCAETSIYIKGDSSTGYKLESNLDECIVAVNTLNNFCSWITESWPGNIVLENISGPYGMRIEVTFKDNTEPKDMNADIARTSRNQEPNGNSVVACSS